MILCLYCSCHYYQCLSSGIRNLRSSRVRPDSSRLTNQEILVWKIRKVTSVQWGLMRWRGLCASDWGRVSLWCWEDDASEILASRMCRNDWSYDVMTATQLTSLCHDCCKLISSYASTFRPQSQIEDSPDVSHPSVPSFFFVLRIQKQTISINNRNNDSFAPVIQMFIMITTVACFYQKVLKL